MEYLRKAYRLFRYREERRKIKKEWQIARKQDILIKEHYSSSPTESLIVFLIPGAEWTTGEESISGGVISIVSLYEETVKLESAHQSTTILCTFPGEYLLSKYENFPNKAQVFRFAQLHSHFQNLKQIVLHIPEYLASRFEANISKQERKWLYKIPRIHVNIMNQNIDLMPTPKEMCELSSISHKATITTAHQRYCSLAYRKLYDIPLHKLSVWISPEQYVYKAYNEKENLIVISPDRHPQKEEVLNILASIPDLEIQIIQGLTYQAYKDLISRAKWSLTFGEGLDGYFIEPVFSGSVSFALFNENFFTSDFAGLRTAYNSMEELISRISEDIIQLNVKDSYEEYQKVQFDLCARHYNSDNYRKNLVDFYAGRYTYA